MKQAQLTTGIGRRFLGLTVAGYLIAVASAVLAVQWGSGPILTRMQDETIREHAAAKAQAVRLALQDMALHLREISRQKDVVNLTIGDETDPAVVLDMLSSYAGPDGLISIELFDFIPDAVARRTYGGIGPAFFASERSVAARRLVDGGQAAARYDFRPGVEPHTAHFMVALPIERRGLLEGALVAEILVDLAPIFTAQSMIGTARLATPFQVEMAHEWGWGAGDNVSVPVDGADFSIMLIPDRDGVAQIGSSLVGKVILAVGVALILPFGMMCVAGYRAIVEPSQALEASREALRRNQRELSDLAAIAKRANEAILTTDTGGRVVWANDAFTAQTGFTLAEARGRLPGDLLQGPGTNAKDRARIAAALRSQKSVKLDILNYRKDGMPYWNALRITPQFNRRGELTRFISFSNDITQERLAHEEMVRAKQAIEYQALHDPLTGLPNRRALDEALARLKEPGAPDRVLIRIDLDHFKNVNDTLGHAAGDFVLFEVSRIILDAMVEGDMAARVGGDEFVLLLGEGRTRTHAEALATKLLHEISKERSFEDRFCRIGASFGIAAAADGLIDNDALLLGADAALYTAKERGRNTVVSYDARMHEGVVKNRRVASEIERGIVRSEFEPYFQPQFDAQTLELAGVEALVRWRHPDHGILAPDQFLRIAEQLSVLDDIDQLVLTKGLQAVADLNAAGLRIPKISFNVVARQLQDPDLPHRVTQPGLEGTKISFEVLESVLVEEQSSMFRFQIDRLKELGFGVEVDDFGSGHASIIGLMQLAPDTMKIDQRLVFPITTSDVARQMVRAILQIGKALDIQVTAEGVETAEHADYLASLGCDTLQGYHFARPMGAADLRSFLDGYRPARWRAEAG